MIDEIARDIAIRKFVLPECLHVPIAAVDANAIGTYVGDIVYVLAKGSPPKAFLVSAKAAPTIDKRLPIWSLQESKVFHERLRVWVHVTYTRYRQAYRKAFPEAEISDRILSHAMNRRVAVLKGFQFVRITPTSRGSNSSSAFSEGWGVAFHSSPEQIEANRKSGASIQYADLTELMLMLDMKLGGGVMNAVNEGQLLVEPRRQ